MPHSEWAIEFIKALKDPSYVRPQSAIPEFKGFISKEFTQLFAELELQLAPVALKE